MNKVIFSLLFFNFLGCATIQYKDTSQKADDGFEVWYTEYTPQPTKKLLRTVIIFPPTGGVTYLEKSYARSLSRKGAQVKVIQGWSGMNETHLNFNLHQDLHEKAMRALAELLKTVPSHHKISLMGTSLGGIYTAVAAGTFDRIDNYLSIAGGASIPNIIANSEHRGMIWLREKRFKKFNLQNNKDYAQRISAEFNLDPLKLPKKFENKKRAQIILLKDTAVPTFYQKKLKDLWKPQKLITLNSSHKTGIILAWWRHSNEIENFLLK